MTVNGPGKLVGFPCGRAGFRLQHMIEGAELAASLK